ncbi:MAG: RagB/SusD family nutrient uptake outer membrane protein, partial [Chitinophagaceae bacterium]
TVFENPTPQATSIIRSFNNSASTGQGNNALIYEWNSMYSLINSCNIVLEILPTIELSADKANAVKAWCSWWKGFAYGQIGTLYYAGLIYDKPGTAGAQNVFVKQDAIITESNKNLNEAINILKTIGNAGEFTSMLSKVIPSQNQVGLGTAPSPADLIATCNTMLARNILFNKLSPFVNNNPNASISKASIPVITSGDWQSIITLCGGGLKADNKIFTGRTSEANSFFSPNGGSVAGMCAFSNQNTTYKVTERLVQSFKAGDKRRANFSTTDGTFYGDANTNSTRWTLVDFDDAGLSGFKTLGTRTVGELEIYIGPTYEENALMLAEANIRTGNIEAGLALIDQVRAYQGAGVATVAGKGLTLVQALNELTQERYAALAFRGLSYFDARRWGWTYAISNGGGRYGATLIFNKIVYTNAKINYNFMDYWDVPGDEIEKNPPATGSAAVVNPNY